MKSIQSRPNLCLKSGVQTGNVAVFLRWVTQVVNEGRL